jgi:hypothetical protein
MSQHTPNISGESTQYCPVCGSRAAFSTPHFDGGTFVELGEARETVLELASQNALTVEDEEGSLAEEAMRQQAALETVEDFVVNHFGADEQEPEPK